MRFCLLLLFALMLPALTSRAQVTVFPTSVDVVVEPDETGTTSLTLTNVTREPVMLVLALRPAEQHPCTPGEFLFATKPEVLEDHRHVAATPEGHVLTSTPYDWEPAYRLNARLEVVGSFETPEQEELLNVFSGFDYDASNRAMWWFETRKHSNGPGPLTVSLARFRGRSPFQFWEVDVEVPEFPEGRGACNEEVNPLYAAVADRQLFWIDYYNDSLWSSDLSGTTLAPYPVRLTDYHHLIGKPCEVMNLRGLDAHSLTSSHGVPGEPLLEVGADLVYGNNYISRVVVTDRLGRNRGAETPLVDLPSPDGIGTVRVGGEFARSRIYPQHLYVSVSTGPQGGWRDWIYAVCAAPLPPSWLRAEEVLLGSVGAGETASADLMLEAEGLEPDEYKGVVEVRTGNGTGPVVAEVPVTLKVVGQVVTEEAASGLEGGLAVHPNPTRGAATVTLTLSVPEEARVSVLDVLGREVAVLHEGVLTPGEHRLTLREKLPAGVYVVRATANGLRASQLLVIAD